GPGGMRKTVTNIKCKAVAGLETWLYNPRSCWKIRRTCTPQHEKFVVVIHHQAVGRFIARATNESGINQLGAVGTEFGDADINRSAVVAGIKYTGGGGIAGSECD